MDEDRSLIGGSHQSNESATLRGAITRHLSESLRPNRKRLTLSGGRQSRPLDTLDEIETGSSNSTANDSIDSVVSPKKARCDSNISNSIKTSVKLRSGTSVGVPSNTPWCESFPEAPLARFSEDLEEGCDKGPDGDKAGCLRKCELVSTPKSSGLVKKTRRRSLFSSEGSRCDDDGDSPVSSRTRRRMSLDSLSGIFKTNDLNESSLHLLPSAISRSVSGLWSSVSRLSKLRTSSSSLHHQCDESISNNESAPQALLDTPKRSGKLLRKVSSLSVKKATHVVKRILTGSQTRQPCLRFHSEVIERDARSTSRRLSGFGTEEERRHRQHERFAQVVSCVRVVKEDLLPKLGNDHDCCLYDAIVCDITPDFSAVSKLVFEKVGSAVLNDLEEELSVIKRKFVSTESGGFCACKCIFWVVDNGTPDNMDKTWQDIRYVFHNMFEKMVERPGIESILLPYLYTGEPARDQARVANAAISSLHLLAEQIGLGKVEKFHIGGVPDTMDCCEQYVYALKRMMEEMQPDDYENVKELSALSDSDNTKKIETPIVAVDGSSESVRKEGLQFEKNELEECTAIHESFFVRDEGSPSH